MERAELGHWLRLAATPEIGTVTARRLLTAFGTPEAVFQQSPHALAQVLSPAQQRQLHTPPATHAALLERTWRWLHSEDGPARQLITLGDSAYPASLLQIEDPPLLVHAMGRLDLWESVFAGAEAPPAIAIVGSRHPTPQGQINAQSFARALSEAGWCVVSGLALGVDGAAHAGALEAAPASPSRLATVAVVGTGLDQVYPRRHQTLAQAIAAQGVLLSEYLLGTPPLAANFPRRNRLIAGLSRGTLVVEAALRSGSLITARLASEQGKEVFAIPGPIQALQSQGCHALIKQGAKLVESLDDVLDELAPLPKRRAAPTAAAAPPPHERDGLLEHIGFHPIGLDALAARTGLSPAELQARLLDLELEGQIARLPGALFQRIVAA